jgi:hypothetical protein
MVACWVVVLLLDMKQRFKRIIDYQRLWMPDAKLKELSGDDTVEPKAKGA